MYILKNAIRSLTRSKGRSLLIGIIVLVIAVAACLGLSIRQAAETAKAASADAMTITAQISQDRSAMLEAARSEDGAFDASAFQDAMSGQGELGLEELETYADADSVGSFYYTTSVSIDGYAAEDGEDTDIAAFAPVETESDSADAKTNESAKSDAESDTDASDQTQQMPEDMPEMPEGADAGGMGGFIRGGVGAQGDFTLTGYSSDAAMTDFIDGTSSITDGVMFDEGSSEMEAIVSDELAAYNNVGVGDEIKLTNPNKEDETYTLKIVGIYSDAQSTVSDSGTIRGFSTADDPANQIYVSYDALSVILANSEDVAETTTDEESGSETTTAMPGQLSGTYVFASMEDYEAFEQQARDLGLSDDYTISSSDVNSYEQSMVPLENLSKMAGYFLIVVLAIGAVILFVINVFNVRERKYEVGVLTAIGMKKKKVAAQFITETCVITILAIILGGVIGGITSVPVTNSLLAASVESAESSSQETNEAFGREFSGNTASAMPGRGNGGNMPENTFGGQTDVDYISQVTSAADMEVFVQLVLIGIALALAASAASVVFIMRYEPLKILSNRD